MPAETDPKTVATGTFRNADTNLEDARAARMAQWAASWSEQFRNDSKCSAPETFGASFSDDENSVCNSPSPPTATP